MRKLNLPAAKLKEDGIHIGELHLPAHLITPNISVGYVNDGVYLLSIELLVSGVDTESGMYQTSIDIVSGKYNTLQGDEE